MSLSTAPFCQYEGLMFNQCQQVVSFNMALSAMELTQQWVADGITLMSSISSKNDPFREDNTKNIRF